MQPMDGKSGETPQSTTHPLLRRVSPENLITLQHHRLTREAFPRACRDSVPSNRNNVPDLPRQDSSGESGETRQSEAEKWFDQSNQNPTATFDSSIMDVDPPFFQKESDSSNDDKLYPFQQMAPPKPTTTRSSSADDYRSVIDDLTVEIQKLKEELKRYKQRGPDMLQKDKLFEIKIHGLPKRKKRELEATLRDFAASLGTLTDASSSQRKKSSRHVNRDHMFSGSGSMSLSKHASSSSGSNARPVDSAYASMSIGANSSGTSLSRPQGSSRFKTNDQKVENYLRDIPKGLYPHYVAMTEKEKKKLVVRRLEHIFTGKFAGRQARRGQSKQATPMPLAAQPGPGVPEVPPSLVQHPNATPELSREARILPQEHQFGHAGIKSRSQDMGSASNSNEDRTESGVNGGSAGTNASPPTQPPLEQRSTRPKDLDPDRVQIPSENMEYIRHLGLVPPEVPTASSMQLTDDVRPDAEGWVYLNLLCNMAQLHMMNVTPDFVRNAVIDLSAKFQLSPDGRKIRWRGGTDGTKFSSDSSGDNSRRSPETDDTENSKEEQHKRQKTGCSKNDSRSSGKNPSKFGPQVSGSSESFHYKPLFVLQGSSNEQSSFEEDTLSSFGPIEESNGDSRWGRSGSGVSNRRKRRRDGAIIYYSGAPFCTDLSGDQGDVSPTSYILSSGQERAKPPPPQFARPLPIRSDSGYSLRQRPLSDMDLSLDVKVEVNDSINPPELATDSEDDASELNTEFPWINEQQFIEVHPLEPCGLGGVLPEDHFLVVVTTRRSKLDATNSLSVRGHHRSSEELTDSLANRLTIMPTSSPSSLLIRPMIKDDTSRNEIEYLSGRIKRLAPVPLPPPVIFFPPFSTDSWSEDEDGSDESDEFSSSEEFMSRQANPHQSDDFPDGIDLSSDDEDGEGLDNKPNVARSEALESDVDDVSPDENRNDSRRGRGNTETAEEMTHGGSNGAIAEVVLRTGGSSAATAGDAKSGYSSSTEDSS